MPVKSKVSQIKAYITKYRWTDVPYDDLSEDSKRLHEILTWVQGRLDEISYELEA